MATVALNTITAFDAGKAFAVSFKYNGSQISANTLIIYNNSDNSQVYSQKIPSMAQKHTIPAGTLTNGGSYYATVTAFYMDGNTEKSVTSSPSNVFLCLETPVWGISIADGAVITSASCDIEITYSQAQGETLGEMSVDVYTANGSLFWTSGPLYDTGRAVTVSGMTDGGQYYVRAHGLTSHGMAVDTRSSAGRDIVFSVRYDTPGIYSLAYLTQDKENGWVRINTDIASIEGRAEGGGISYVDGGTAADLTQVGTAAVFDDNFRIGENMGLMFRGRNFMLNRPIITFSSTEGFPVSLTMRSGVFSASEGEKYFMELRVNAPAEYVIFSGKIPPPASTDILQIKVIRENGYYSVGLSPVQ